MLRPITVLLSGLLLLSACSPAQKVNYHALHELGRENTLEVYLRNGDRFQGDSMRIDGDTVRWLDPMTKRPLKVLKLSVRKIVAVDHARGLLDGFLIGGSAGAVAGLTFAIASGSELGGLGAMIFGGSLLGAGIIAGSIIGGVNGHTTEYIIGD